MMQKQTAMKVLGGLDDLGGNILGKWLQVGDAKDVLVTAGKFSDDLSEYFQKLIKEYGDLQATDVNQSSAFLTKTKNATYTEFTWTPNKQPSDGTQAITFYVYIPADWPNFNIPDFAAFQVLYYFTILQKFIYDVSDQKPGTWLKTFNPVQTQSVWNTAFEKAKKEIDNHHESMKTYKTKMTYSAYLVAVAESFGNSNNNLVDLIKLTRSAIDKLLISGTRDDLNLLLEATEKLQNKININKIPASMSGGSDGPVEELKKDIKIAINAATKCIVEAVNILKSQNESSTKIPPPIQQNINQRQKNPQGNAPAPNAPGPAPGNIPAQANTQGDKKKSQGGEAEKFVALAAVSAMLFSEEQ